MLAYSLICVCRSSHAQESILLFPCTFYSLSFFIWSSPTPNKITEIRSDMASETLKLFRKDGKRRSSHTQCGLMWCTFTWHPTLKCLPVCSPAEEPSMCYYYDGDGVCEDFERETGVRDCGLYTPSGFLDQWASAVEVSHEERPYCSGEVASGYPAVTKVRPDVICNFTKYGTSDNHTLQFTL